MGSPAGKVVLVVEDDGDIREEVAHCLEAEGYAVRVAENGKSAVEQLSTGVCPGVILLDLMMPVMDGYELLAKLQKHSEWSTIPVIIMSAHLSAQPQNLGGVFRVLRKPVGIDGICDAVRDALAA